MLRHVAVGLYLYGAVYSFMEIARARYGFEDESTQTEWDHNWWRCPSDTAMILFSLFWPVTMPLLPILIAQIEAWRER